MLRQFVYIAIIAFSMLCFGCIRKHPVKICSESKEISKERGFFLFDYEYQFKPFMPGFELNDIEVFSEYIYYGYEDINDYFCNQANMRQIIVSMEKCPNVKCVNLMPRYYNGNRYGISLDSSQKENENIMYTTMLVCLKTKTDTLDWADRYRPYTDDQKCLNDEIPIGILKFHKKE